MAELSRRDFIKVVSIITGCALWRLMGDRGKAKEIYPIQGLGETSFPTETTVEKIKTLELLRKYYDDTILPGRQNHLAGLSEEDRLKMLESVGGEENLNNGLFTVVIIGKDTWGEEGKEGGGFDSNGNALGRNDQTQVVFVDINNNTINVISIPRDIALPTNMYGPSTPSNFNGLTWIDQVHSTEDGKYISLDREIAQKVITDATGYYVDGIVEFDFESAETIVDVLFPDGVEVTMQDTFYPECAPLGEISGIGNDGRYKPFLKGETYTFHGNEIVWLLRSRKTRQGDTYQREGDAAIIISELMVKMIHQFVDVNNPAELGQRLNSLKSLKESIISLESSGHLQGHFWGESKDPSTLLTDLLRVIIEEPEKMWNTAVSYNTYGREVFPTISYYSPKTEEMVAAPGREHKVVFPSGVRINNPEELERNPLVFWSYLREKVKLLIKGDDQ
jgi:anionic cell wall polymer biosynthesis LytR-Cps2A-Psr (LCP) family protein